MAKRNKNWLRYLRITLAAIFFVGITLMFCDFTGLLHQYLGWMAKIQLLPAILSIGAGATLSGVLIVAGLAFITLLFGRVYCSVICPLGVMQDIFNHLAGYRFLKKISKKLGPNRFHFVKEHKVLRFSALAIFFVMLAIPATAFAAHIIAPYSAYGRIAQALFAPLYALCNNGLAMIADYYGSYAIYPVDVYIKSVVTLVIAAITFCGISLLAYMKGRTWCNTICPVGTLLGNVARFAVFRPVIDTDKCNGCGKCGKNCKAQCIDTKNHVVDLSRCVDCFDCIDYCAQGAISYSPIRLKNKPIENTTPEEKTTEQTEDIDNSRRQFLGVVGGLAAAGIANAQHKTDGGLAAITKKKIPQRAVALRPAGAISQRHFTSHCTACQLCVSACPNQVLRPSNDIMTLMQPEMQFEKGYCPPTCHKCADVCPTGAIYLENEADKAAIQIGHAVWIADNCVVLTDGVSCGNCERHCPTGAIIMVPHEGNEKKQIPAVDSSKCIGCGHCEYVCPSRPFSAIYVEGYENHHEN